MSAETGPLLMEAIAETLWGRRGIVKAVHVWLPLALLMTTADPLADVPAWLCALPAYASAACYTQAAILANDLADRNRDRAARKRRWIVRCGPLPGGCIVAAFALLGLAALWVCEANPRAAGAYLAAIALAFMYSFRPVRLKERGGFGPATYSLSTALAYAVVPWALFPSSRALLVLPVAAVFLDKWTNLYFHQLVDRDRDRQSGIRTFATERDPGRVRRLLGFMAWATALLLAVVLVWALRIMPSGGIVIGAVAVGMILAIIARVRSMRHGPSGRANELIRELPAPYLALTLVLFRLLPLMLIGRLALERRHMTAPFLLLVILVAVESRQALRYRHA